MSRDEETLIEMMRQKTAGVNLRATPLFRFQMIMRRKLYDRDRFPFSSRELDEICSGIRIKLPMELNISDEFLEAFADITIELFVQYIDGLDEHVNNPFYYIRAMAHDIEVSGS